MTPPFHVLAKPAGARCNLACQYCFYGEKEDLYPGSSSRMSDETLELYVSQYLSCQDGPEVTLSWQGGEPTLMGLDFFRRSVDLSRTHARGGQHVAFTIQTNGVLLDDQWCSFFADNDFLVGLSLDGPPDVHDAYRVDRGGGPTFDRVVRAHDLLGKHGVACNVMCSVHAANADHPLEVYRFLRDEVGARFLQFIPIVEKTGGDPPVSARSVRPAQWGAFLSGVFDEWVGRDVGRVFVQAFDAALARWVGVTPGVCLFLETCGQAVVLEHNGDVYACDHFVDPSHRLGNIAETPLGRLVESARQRSFGAAKRDSLPRCCLECEVVFACRGECPRNRFLRTPDNQPGLNYLCAGYRSFFNHVREPMEVMKRLLQQRRAPALVMSVDRS